MKQRFNDRVITKIRIQHNCFKINVIKLLKTCYTAYVSFTVHDDILGLKEKHLHIFINFKIIIVISVYFRNDDEYQTRITIIIS